MLSPPPWSLACVDQRPGGCAGIVDAAQDRGDAVVVDLVVEAVAADEDAVADVGDEVLDVRALAERRPERHG